MANADVVALAIPAHCQLVWVLSHGHKISSAEIAEGGGHLLDSANVVVNLANGGKAGFALLDAGGDIADAIIAYEGPVIP